MFFSSVDIDVFVHHGTSKALIALELQDKHIVLTTYGTLSAEFKDEMHGPLLRAKWLRVVLDEGHLIKNHLAKIFKAAKTLDAERKWIVSGTPIQNNLTELWALLNWIEEPNYGGNRPMFNHQVILFNFSQLEHECDLPLLFLVRLSVPLKMDILEVSNVFKF